MIVYCNVAFQQESWDKNVIAGDFFSGIIHHFQGLNLGSSVNEIAYFAVSGDSNFRLAYGEGMNYRKRSKTIASLFFMDYDIIKGLDKLPFYDFLGEQLLSESEKIEGLNIKDFQFDEYIFNLKGYLEEAKKLMTEGVSPSSGKELNTEIQIAMAKKYSGL